MSVDWGFESPIFMAKGVVQQAHPLLLKRAVIEVITHLDNAHETGSSPVEIIDRLVQVTLTGEYRAPNQDEKTVKVVRVPSEDLSQEDEEKIQDFVDRLNGLNGLTPDEEVLDEDNENYEDFLKRLGIPNEDEDDEDEDDDPQPA